jgi:hypothetical protein
LAKLTSPIIATLIIIAIILGIVVGYYLGPRPTYRTTITSVSTSTFTSDLTVISSSISTVESISTMTSAGQTMTVFTGSSSLLPSLQLTADVLPVNASPGQNISMIADVYNSLPYNVTLNATSIVNPSQGPCAQNQATAVNVYSGHYTFVNISHATPLLLYNASQDYLCPAQFHFTYTFLANSDNATVMTLPPFSFPTIAEIVNETSTLSGYWTKSENSYAFQNFGPGQYTVLVMDAWSQETICYFQVS